MKNKKIFLCRSLLMDVQVYRELKIYLDKSTFRNFLIARRYLIDNNLSSKIDKLELSSDLFIRSFSWVDTGKITNTSYHDWIIISMSWRNYYNKKFNEK